MPNSEWWARERKSGQEKWNLSESKKKNIEMQDHNKKYLWECKISQRLRIDWKRYSEKEIALEMLGLMKEVTF